MHTGGAHFSRRCTLVVHTSLGGAHFSGRCALLKARGAQWSTLVAHTSLGGAHFSRRCTLLWTRGAQRCTLVRLERGCRDLLVKAVSQREQGGDFLQRSRRGRNEIAQHCSPRTHQPPAQPTPRALSPPAPVNPPAPINAQQRYPHAQNRPHGAHRYHMIAQHGISPPRHEPTSPRGACQRSFPPHWTPPARPPRTGPSPPPLDPIPPPTGPHPPPTPAPPSGSRRTAGQHQRLTSARAVDHGCSSKG